ncbi:MAG: M18 family aminopeptidase [Lachnospiraceae bacterium]|jgi:aspartyl aminopeptidase|uniref:M18 family aminopeptidase n=1 Tax=Candidatus Merdisoma sp. JLR.KK006 TaxID=3112626 RepID=UPI002FF13AD2|nr:M18 family aminopeptidase [Lachnospiraceae bacterium]
MFKKISQEMTGFLKECPTAFHAVERIGKELESNGYERLKENEQWELKTGGKYYVTRNDSSIIAFGIGSELMDYSFNIAASHSDFPTFKVKENAEIEVKKKYLQLNTEGYGGMLCATWFDRPLSVAGRVIVKEGDHFTTKLINIDRDLVMIPSMAIHMNRAVNDGYAYNKQIDMLPLFGGEGSKKGDFKKLIAEAAGVSEEAVYGSDIYLYNREEASVWGAQEEFISCQHLDDLQCAYASLKGFLQGHQEKSVNVYACFDNEEVGSGTKQGAGSTFLYDILRRINMGLGKSEEDYYRAVAGSFMLSADNAHAVHPNHPEKTDVENCVYMNEGIVVKSHAGQKYTSDAVSIALFRDICEKAEVPVQFFANRSDEAGGSTLGNISSAKVSLKAVDIGLPQLAMHSAYETAGVKDTCYMIKAMKQFFSTHFYESNGSIFSA